MQETTYTCDRCKASEKELGSEANQIELYDIEVTVKSTRGTPRYPGIMQAQWCIKCISETGATGATDEIRAKALQQEKIRSERITLEELIYEMVEDACSNQ
jgi:hypothetical protein